MIKEVKMYTVICDGCGADSCEGSEYSAWGEEDCAVDCARESDWEEIGDKQYCPDCYEYDDDGNPIVKTKKINPYEPRGNESHS